MSKNPDRQAEALLELMGAAKAFSNSVGVTKPGDGYFENAVVRLIGAARAYARTGR